MSKFIDQLKNITKGDSTSMGFRRSSAASSAKKIKLVACVSKPDSAEAAEADFVVLDIPEKVDPDVIKTVPADLLWGACLKDGNKEDVTRLKEAGCDFVIFPCGTPLAIVQEKEIGKILEIDASLNDALVRTLLEIPVDAVMVTVPQEGEVLTWKDLMVLQRFGGLPGKPLLAKVKSSVTVTELEAFWAAGVYAVVAESGIKELRKGIDAADFTPKRKKDKDTPVIS